MIEYEMVRFYSYILRNFSQENRRTIICSVCSFATGTEQILELFPYCAYFTAHTQRYYSYYCVYNIHPYSYLKDLILLLLNSRRNLSPTPMVQNQYLNPGREEEEEEGEL